jgi:endonuclease-3 related protein
VSSAFLPTAGSEELRDPSLNDEPSSPQAKAWADYYGALRGHFGYADVWWPGSPLEVTLTAMLVQQCDWSAAWNAVGRLKEAGLLDLDRLQRADLTRVHGLLNGVSFAPTKARRLVQLAETILQQGFGCIEELLAGDDTHTVREQLLALPGVGRETADCILLFASDRHETFIVDAYTRRLLQRRGIFPDLDDNFWSGPYETLRRFLLRQTLEFRTLYDGYRFAAGVPRAVALLRDFHAQILELGRHHCLKNRPRCTSRGKGGWQDYPFCRDHCANNSCASCPVMRQCASARTQPE